MGFSVCVRRESIMIKFVLTACLVAAAKADADPFYGAYGAYGYAAHGLHGAVYGVPFGSSSGLDPITQGLDASTQGFAPYYHGYGKRSADAFYGVLPYAAAHPAVAAVPFGSSTGLDPITPGLDASTQGYAPYYHGYLGHHYGKRSADAYYGVLPYAHHAVAYAGVPFGSSTGLDPIPQGLDPVTQGYVPYYHSLHYGKRDADPYY